VEDQTPWKLAKTDPEAARGVLTAALEAGRILAIYLKPVLPEFSAKVEKFLGVGVQTWRNVQDSMEPHKINVFEHLVARLDSKAVDAMVEESKDGAKPAAAPAAGGKAAADGTRSVPATGGHPVEEALQPTITIDQFAAVDLRVARVLTAAPVEKSDKLMKLTVDVGHLGQRTVLAGIKKAYTAEQLTGRLVIIAANLAPRTMGKFGTSEGMICAAGPGGTEIYVLAPDSGAQPGQRVH
jgi:methionyl-tRNA synthetase